MYRRRTTMEAALLMAVGGLFHITSKPAAQAIVADRPRSRSRAGKVRGRHRGVGTRPAKHTATSRHHGARNKRRSRRLRGRRG